MMHISNRVRKHWPYNVKTSVLNRNIDFWHRIWKALSHQHRNTLSKISSNYINDNIPENTAQRVKNVCVWFGSEPSSQTRCLITVFICRWRRTRSLQNERGFNKEFPLLRDPTQKHKAETPAAWMKLWEHRRQHRLTEVSSVSSEERCDVMRSSSTVLNTNSTAVIQAFITVNKRQEFTAESHDYLKHVHWFKSAFIWCNALNVTVMCLFLSYLLRACI